MKRITTNKALTLLAGAALLNEDIISFLNGCYTDDRYCDLGSVESLAMDARGGTVLQASVEVVLDWKDAGAFLQEIQDEATKNKDFGALWKSSHLLKRLLSLTKETGGEKAGTE